MNRSTRGLAQARTERAVGVLRRVLDLANSVVSGVRWLAIVAGLAVTIAWAAGVASAPPHDAADWGVRLVVLALLLVPSGVLVAFLLGIRELRELPSRFRELPADVRDHASELGDLRTGARPTRGLIGSVIGLARLVVGSRDLLSPYAIVAAALRPTLLVATLFAAIAAIFEIPASLLVLLLLS